MTIEEIRAKAQQAWAMVEQMPDGHPLRELAIKKAIEWDDLVVRREMEK